jgi:hypothetical protein
VDNQIERSASKSPPKRERASRNLENVSCAVLGVDNRIFVPIMRIPLLSGDVGESDEKAPW